MSIVPLRFTVTQECVAAEQDSIQLCFSLFPIELFVKGLRVSLSLQRSIGPRNLDCESVFWGKDG